MRATYSPEDNKLRIYPDYRLPADEYAKVKAAGFKWAPKQEIFVAPMWTPSREALALEMCGEIEDEDTSLVERAEDRAERFEEYSDKRAADAERAHEYVQSICENIPLGQPILVGHHSERHARKDAQRIENGMRKAVNMWETSKYWTQRAAGALRAAKYKELPAVRARRIKSIEADKRKQERNKADAEKHLKAWLAIRDKDMTQETKDAFALHVSGADFFYMRFPLADYPREPPASQYEGEMSLYTALKEKIITTAQAANLVIPRKQRSVEHSNKWIAHYENRLAYEKAMLDEQGASDLIAPKARPKQLPLLNYRIPEGLQIENRYHRGEFIHYSQIEMTKAEYAKAYADDKGTREIEGSHRVRTIVKRGQGYSSYSWHCVFLTDSKVHTKPEPVAPKPVEPSVMPLRNVYKAPERTKFDDLKDSLKAGVSTVSAPQLFPTPQDIAEQMVNLAEIEPGMSVLEPSAGTGNLLKVLPNIRPNGHITAVEISQELAASLEPWADDIIVDDFLSQNGNLGEFDRIIMNPPFKNGEDIKHIKHAVTFLNPSGKLVALCANGPRQKRELQDIADYWEVLPEGSFTAQGTNVSVVMLIVTKQRRQTTVTK